MPCVGIDFGTTNSALAVLAPDGTPHLAHYPSRGGPTSTFRSILYFIPERRDARRKPLPWCGPEAIDHYLETDSIGRLIQSMKSHLASHGFMATSVFNVNFTLEELVALFIADLKAGAARELGDPGRRAVVGRPVHFSGDDDNFALARLRAGLSRGGFNEVVFEYEPVAAAWHYERGLDHDELVLIADFGGGTSDFCLIRVGPEARRQPSGSRILGTEGVALAGDAFDSRIIRRVVAPALGLGTEYRAAFHGALQPVPVWIYSQLRRWHQLSFMKSREVMNQLHQIKAQAVEPERIEGLIHLIDFDLGYHLYRAVEQTKIELSSREASRFFFRDPPVEIDVVVTRQEFEAWIEPELEAIRQSVTRLLEKTGVVAGDVDRVFMTGGSSFVPAVRRIFADRFGAEKLAGGEELTSVARGLALRAADLDR